jgi:hypothetical protein
MGEWLFKVGLRLSLSNLSSRVRIGYTDSHRNHIERKDPGLDGISAITA